MVDAKGHLGVKILLKLNLETEYKSREHLKRKSLVLNFCFNLFSPLDETCFERASSFRLACTASQQLGIYNSPG